MAAALFYGVGGVGFSQNSGAGLSGLVSVKGSVNAEALKLSDGEVTRINRVVNDLSSFFSQVDIYLDAKGSKEIDSNTVLVMALVLETNGDCEIRSWSRKVAREDFVPQLERYMQRAAAEYKQFKRYPDVKQDFKCLYI